jgi:cell division protein FtsB
MNMAEGAAFRALAARVESLERQVADLTRRLDDIRKAEQAKERETLKLKHA